MRFELQSYEFFDEENKQKWKIMIFRQPKGFFNNKFELF